MDKQLTESYCGHELVVTAHERRRGAWSWNYLIDGFSRAGATLPDAQAALHRVMRVARLRVDDLA